MGLWARGEERGTALIEALCALALVGFAATGAGALVHLAAQLRREAQRLDEASAAAESALARLETLSFRALPEHFGVGPGAAAALLDTASGAAPDDWRALVAGLPDGRLRAELQGLGAGGGATAFTDALALRVRVRVAWRESSGERAVELTDVRF